MILHGTLLLLLLFTEESITAAKRKNVLEARVSMLEELNELNASCVPQVLCTFYDPCLTRFSAGGPLPLFSWLGAARSLPWTPCVPASIPSCVKFIIIYVLCCHLTWFSSVLTLMALMLWQCSWLLSRFIISLRLITDYADPLRDMICYTEK